LNLFNDNSEEESDPVLESDTEPTPTSPPLSPLDLFIESIPIKSEKKRKRGKKKEIEIIEAPLPVQPVFDINCENCKNGKKNEK
jgi:hypothetical protein